jgi:hypothetical protein
MIDSRRVRRYNASKFDYPMSSKKSTTSFSGHETFPFRYGWLKKGVDAVSKAENGSFFSRDDAMIELGVGKNMVQSIRHWCIVTDVIELNETGGSHCGPTEFGEKIFLHPGYDPYLEDPATLWLLHWQIASNKQRATTWYWLFNLWHSVEFTKAQLVDEITAWIEHEELKPITINTLRRDIDTCLRTYVSSRRTNATSSEDSFSCPLTELNLIAEMEDGRSFQISRGEQRSLPNEVFMYALTQFWEANFPELNSLALERIAYDSGGPGRIFKLDTESIARRLEVITAEADSPYFFEEKSGLKQLYRRDLVPAERWLQFHYSLEDVK